MSEPDPSVRYVVLESKRSAAQGIRLGLRGRAREQTIREESCLVAICER